MLAIQLLPDQTNPALHEQLDGERLVPSLLAILEQFMKMLKSVELAPGLDIIPIPTWAPESNMSRTKPERFICRLLSVY